MKISFKIFIIMSVMLSNFCIAQPDTLWTKVYGGIGYDWGYTVQQTSDSGFIIVGQSNSFTAGDIDLWLLKTDSNGDTLWTRTMGGNADDEGWYVLQTPDGGYIMSGHAESFGPGDDDFWFIKTDPLGFVEWEKTYGGIEDNDDCVFRRTPDQGYILLGEIESPDTGNDDLWLIKTNNNGDTLWTKTIGDSLDDDVGSIEVTSDSGFILTLTFESDPTYDENIKLIKTDQYGDTIWTKNYGGDDDERVTPNSVRQTADGGYIIFASTQSIGAGGEDIWMIKTDANGDSVWSKTHGGLNDDVSMCGLQTIDGGYIVLGRTSSYGGGGIDVWLIKTDSEGNILWTKTIGGPLYDIGLSVQQTFDGGYIITGATQSFASNLVDLWLIRISTDTSINLLTKDKSIITSFSLKQNYPNPFNPVTNIEFSIPKTESVTLKIYNLLGQEVTTLVSDKLTAGIYKYAWDASGFASGIYYYKIEAGKFMRFKKMILIK